MVSCPVIVALDYANLNEALALVDTLDGNQCAIKIGSEMFTLFGPDFVRTVMNQGFRVFLDLKFHDIPNTVAASCAAAAELGVWMVNIHTQGGMPMMRAAKEALQPYGAKRPLLIGVTILTSFNQDQLQQVGIESRLIDQTSHLAKLGFDSGLDGVVCSAHEAARIKQHTSPDFITVTPGIRPANAPLNDQVRVMTPSKAIQAGSDYLVIGRPITRAASPKQALNDVLCSLKQ